MAEPALERPPYRVPSMAEVRSAPRSGLVVASTFAGCGGSCLGYRMAGYRVAWANEFQPNARECYAANADPGSLLDPRDVRQIQPGEVLEALGLGVGELDLLDGSPPCQAFSTAGPRARTWGKVVAHADGTKQASDDLFLEYARLLDGLRPRAFVAENVAGLAIGVSRGYLREILAALRRPGYVVEVRQLDAQWLGVPQVRRRLIFQGVRDDLAERGIGPAFPDPLPYRYAMRDALPWVESGIYFNAGVGTQAGPRGITGRPIPTVMGQTTSNHYATDRLPPPELGLDEVDREVRWLGGQIRERWDRLRLGQKHPVNFSLKRSDAARPASPVQASHGAGDGMATETPPLDARKFSIVELRRLCGFPDDFVMVGTYKERWARLGNSVPPPMARAIGEAVRDRVLLPARDLGI